MGTHWSFVFLALIHQYHHLLWMQLMLLPIFSGVVLLALGKLNDRPSAKHNKMWNMYVLYVWHVTVIGKSFKSNLNDITWLFNFCFIISISISLIWGHFISAMPLSFWKTLRNMWDSMVNYHLFPWRKMTSRKHWTPNYDIWQCLPPVEWWYTSR